MRSEKIRIITIVGARPQFIKAAVLSRLFREEGVFTEYLVHTGQHYDHGMSQVFFDELGLPRPDLNLGIGGGTHGRNTGRMIEQIEACLMREKPAAVLVYGDTDSTLAGALAAVKIHVPVIHVEAGLRSFNRRMPEEHNRVLTDHCSDLLFTPSAAATRNLQNEGIPEERIFEVGDIMYDAVKYYSQHNGEESIRVLRELELQPGGYILATIHRAENTDSPERLAGILGGLDEIASTGRVVLPLHPRTKQAIERQRLSHLLRRLTVIEPVGYLAMLVLQQHARLIATDSGGVQKEAYYLGRPCITLREETEWVELVETGWNQLVGADTAVIVSASRHARTGGNSPLYGEGHAGKGILSKLRCYLK